MKSERSKNKRNPRCHEDIRGFPLRVIITAHRLAFGFAPYGTRASVMFASTATRGMNPASVTVQMQSTEQCEVLADRQRES